MTNLGVASGEDCKFGITCLGEPDDRLGRQHGWSSAEPALDDRLRERGLLTDAELTVAGALVLTDPSQTLGTRKFVIEIRLYEDAGTAYRRRVVIGGSLPGQVEEAAEFVSAELGSDLVVIGVLRHDLPRLPAPVIREAIANAVSHRSYELDQSAVIVEIRPQQVIVTSPGRLPDSVTVETMREAQAARNPAIIDVLRRFGLTEDAGRGVDVMQDVMREEMLDPPVFEEVGEFLRVTLPINGPVTPQERAWLKDLEAEGALEPPDRLLLAHAARGEALTNSRAREITRLDRVYARAALHRLRDTGFLVQQGQRGGTNYVLARGIGHGAVLRLSEPEVERMVLDEAARGPIRNEDVRRLTGLDRADVSALLSRLTTRGRLVRQGEKRGTEYVVGRDDEGVHS
jgi:ATP-dependent DNA helicase RecG